MGVAPLTSMFFHGEHGDRRFDDFRPEVHDSDGLLIAMHSGEWLWRPLNNPRKVATSVFAGEDIAGFGLMQRDRIFDHYQDLISMYHARPSAWVEPLGRWGPGSLCLIEIPSDAEFYDNIVPFLYRRNRPLPARNGFSTIAWTSSSTVRRGHPEAKPFPRARAPRAWAGSTAASASSSSISAAKPWLP